MTRRIGAGAWAVAGLTLLAAVIRFFHAGTPALWTDEAFSLWVARHSLPEIWRVTARLDAHPPLYYALLHYWLIFGEGETALRALSAVLGALTVPAAYLLGRTIGGARLGLLTALLLAVSPFNLWYDQEARMYALLMLAATAALLGLALVLREPTARAGWAFYIVGTVAALWTEHSAALLLLSANVLVVLLRRPLHLSGAFFRRWAAAHGLILLLWSPVLVTLTHQLAAGTAGPTSPIGWGVVLATLPDAFAPISGAAHVQVPVGARVAAAAFGLCLVAPLMGSGIMAWRHEYVWTAYVLIVWLVPVAAAVLVGLIWLPVLTPATLTSGYRTLIWMSLPPYLLAGAGVSALRHRGVQAAALALLLVGAAADLAIYYRTVPKWEAWDQAADYIAGRVAAGDLILIHENFAQLPFDYYFRRHARAAVEQGVPRNFPGDDVRELRMTPADVSALKALARSHRRVWLVYTHEWWTDPGGIVPATLSQTGALAGRKIFPGLPSIQIYRFSEYGTGQ